ncbi:GNAT family N-acetyltransferase [Staphylococcus edaphicus]|uniref:GNAT family N-acetyltransferase n=1 Tax=Staphylococcus edaphicus TaxID=1955013 RepID=A0A2C6WPH6_9STAP|nr:GNAT family N-acetyltransferase [Staphylococcus edaphicus]PHK49975.1 GNAT family N-acetyltransferase [Staphylococcus edaphicus]UQW81764.1 GNAT family N-acetyltransferase [Staphylococcus edaphicus]
MTIRQANDDELTVISNEIPKLFKEAITANFDLADASLHNMSNQLREQGAKYYVLIEDDILKGFVLIDKRTDHIVQRDYGFIYELYVFENYRRQGLAEKLIHFVNEEFKKQGIYEVRLNVDAQNKAQYLYEKMGFHNLNITKSINLIE